jgi:hypothetical protein
MMACLQDMFQLNDRLSEADPKQHHPVVETGALLCGLLYLAYRRRIGDWGLALAPVPGAPVCQGDLELTVVKAKVHGQLGRRAADLAGLKGLSQIAIWLDLEALDWDQGHEGFQSSLGSERWIWSPGLADSVGHKTHGL